MLFADALWLGLAPADWIVLAVYFLVILFIGLWSMRKVKDMADFFMGGRRFGAVSMMFFAFGAGTSSEQAVGVVAGTYRVGLAGIWWQFLWLWATPFYWIVAPIMRRMRALTTADFFENRFSPSTALLYSVYGIAMSIVFIAGGIYATGKMVNALTGNELDKMSRRLDWQVPDIKWDRDRGWFGRGTLTHVTQDADTITTLDAGRVPMSVAEQIGLLVPLSDELSVTTTVSGSEWTVRDNQRNVDYVLRKVPVPAKTPAEDAPPQDGANKAAADGLAPPQPQPQETHLQVKGSGWRQVQGYEFAILAMTFLFVVYGMLGGLGAAIITDLIQGILTIAFSFLLLPFVFAKIGGFGNLHSEGELRQGMFNLVGSAEVAKRLDVDPITIFYVVMLSITALAGIVVQPHIMGVCGAGKTEFEGRFGFTFGNFLKRLCTVAWTFTGLACLVWYLGSNSPLPHKERPATESAAFADLPAEEQAKIKTDRELYADLKLAASDDFKNLPKAKQDKLEKTEKAFADGLFGKAAYDILPTIAPGLVGLLLASLLAAVMSTGDAQMVVSSGLFTENIYRRYVSRKRSERHYVWIGRLSGLVFVLIALVLQSSFTDIIHALKIIIKTPAAIGISLWIGIVWRGWTAAAVWTSTIVSLTAWALLANFPEVAQGWGLPDYMFRIRSNGDLAMIESWQNVFYLSAGVIVGFLTSFVTRQTSDDKLDRFFRLLHTPVRPDEFVESPCALPDNPLPANDKLLNLKSIELPKPSFSGVAGFVIAWICAGVLVWLTALLARIL